MVEINKIKSPFIFYCQKVIPLAFDESLSYYEVLCNLTYKLKEVIDEQNSQGEGIIELQNKYIELKNYVDHYFDNVDFQEEIDHKLDEMAESGELADIIAQYLQLAGVLVYDTVEDMAQADNLSNGSVAKTLGYYEIGDGGGSFYKIKTLTSQVIDNALYIQIGDSLVAELILMNKIINVKCFGAKGDNLVDDTSALQKAIDYATENRPSTVYSPSNQNYKVTAPLQFTRSYVGFDFSNSTITGYGNINIINIGDHDTVNHAPYGQQIYYTTFKNLLVRAGDTDVNIGIFANAPWCEFDNIEIRGDVLGTRKFSTAGFYFTESWDSYIHNCTATDISGVAFYSPWAANNQTFERCTVQRCDNNCFDVRVALSVAFRDCDVQYQQSTTGCAFYVYQTFGVSFDNIYMERCWRGIYLDGGTISVKTNATYFNFQNVETDTQPKYAFIIGQCSNVVINAYFENSKETDIGVYCPDSTVANKIVIGDGTAYRSFTGTKYSNNLTTINDFKDYTSDTALIYEDTRFKKMLYLDGEMSSSRDYIKIEKPVRTKKSLKGTVNITNLITSNDKILNFIVTDTTNFMMNIDVTLYNTDNFSESMNVKFVVSGVIYNNASVVSLSKHKLADIGSITNQLSIDTVSYNASTHDIAVTIKNAYSGWTHSKGIASCELICDDPRNIW